MGHLSGRLFTGLHWEQGRALATYLDVAEPVPSGTALAWRLDGPRRCTGIYHGRTERRRPCPRSSPVGERSQCGTCAGADPGRLIAQDRADPSGTFRTYLALFGRSTIKVGLTARGRSTDRLLEQAAAAHVFVCTGPYDEARHAELLLSSGLGIPEHLSWSRKRELWSDPGTAVERAAVLAEQAARARALVSADGRARVLPDEPVVDHAARYGLEALPRDRRVVTSPEADDVLAGTVVGVLGRLLVLDDGLVLDSRALEGWTVTTAGEQTRLAVAPLVESTVAQPSLF